jgi:hypothetical protein
MARAVPQETSPIYRSATVRNHVRRQHDWAVGGAALRTAPKAACASACVRPQSPRPVCSEAQLLTQKGLRDSRRRTGGPSKPLTCD